MITSRIRTPKNLFLKFIYNSLQIEKLQLAQSEEVGRSTSELSSMPAVCAGPAEVPSTPKRVTLAHATPAIHGPIVQAASAKLEEDTLDAACAILGQDLPHDLKSPLQQGEEKEKGSAASKREEVDSSVDVFLKNESDTISSISNLNEQKPNRPHQIKEPCEQPLETTSLDDDIPCTFNDAGKGLPGEVPSQNPPTLSYNNDDSVAMDLTMNKLNDDGRPFLVAVENLGAGDSHHEGK